ncbi:MAG: hypothetical protein GYB35_08180 [Algicola sp.]|nr:hypothetical protein [Algicola sp.]
MKTRKKMTPKFYQNLGKLFYVMAACDGMVRPVEVEKLKSIIKEQWLKVDDIHDVFNADAAYQIEIVFDWLHQEDLRDIEEYYSDFVDYKREQSHLFTDDVKQLILKTASEIANAFSGINKSELIMLAKLDLELKVA